MVLFCYSLILFPTSTPLRLHCAPQNEEVRNVHSDLRYCAVYYRVINLAPHNQCDLPTYPTLRRAGLSSTSTCTHTSAGGSSWTGDATTGAAVGPAGRQSPNDFRRLPRAGALSRNLHGYVDPLCEGGVESMLISLLHI